MLGLGLPAQGRPRPVHAQIQRDSVLAHLLDDLLGHAHPLRGDDLLDERLDVGFHGHDLHGFLGCAIQRNHGDGAAPGVQLPSRLDPPVDLLVPDLRHAIDPIAQRPEQEDVVQRPARGLHCQAAGLQDEPRRPHGPRVGGSGHAHARQGACDRSPAGRRSRPIRTGAAGRPAGRLGSWRVDPAPAPGLARCDPPNHRGLRAPSAGCPGPDCRPPSRGPASRRGAEQHRRRAARSRSRRLPGSLRSACGCLCHLSEPPVTSPLHDIFRGQPCRANPGCLAVLTACECRCVDCHPSQPTLWVSTGSYLSA